MTKNTAIRIALGLAAVLSGSAAMAQDNTAKEIEFGYRAAELETPAAQTKLERRLDRFVARQCRTSSPLVSYRMQNDCRIAMREELHDKIFGGTVLAKR